MRLGAALLIIVAALALVVTWGSAAPAARKRPNCIRSGTTIVANDLVRVFRMPKGGGTSFFAAFACEPGKGRMRRLGSRSESASGSEGLGAFALSRTMVATDSALCGREGECDAVLRVLDVRSGRTLHRVSAKGSPAAALVVTAKGSGAWMRFHAGQWEIWRADADGTARIDAGADIEKGLLALAGRRLFWMTAGQPQTATIR